ncbi:DUF3857 domain-containing protein [Flammeovirga agarivorans]|uniref:DUF3857 and transglutaminase domain-containing protein n=1 Tax=Flammeovirga agarivorans TaxID=2726742 RepID=A0A7X8XYY0_9BACT|nr:DUF3857 domain-containing protein [Flammeovirga agarivorans]NLR94636.1 DUF3857 and transglutaminase domain-containing protein [Flammeovirga agarivorans]
MKYLFIITLLFTQFSFGQTKKIKFGEISKEEIDMKIYQKDKDAKAVILFDKGESYFYDNHGGYDIRFTRHKRLKIFDKTDTKNAEVSIFYYINDDGKSEKVKSIKAVTYNYNNGIQTKKELDASSVYEEKINSRWRCKKFVFPNVQDGSILEYTYKLETPFKFNLPNWEFQSRIPTIYSEYNVSLIPFYEYVFQLQGISRFDYRNSVRSRKTREWGGVAKVYGQNVSGGLEFYDQLHTYVLKDVPAFVDESFISSINDYLIKINFQLSKFNQPTGGSISFMTTWTELNELLLKNDNFGKYIKGSSKIAKKILATELNISSQSDRDKAKTIIKYVKNNFEWNGYNGKYASQSPKSFYNHKEGNSADINLFMIALLNEAGVETKPLILSTRQNGKLISKYPFDHSTNYVIAFLNIESPFMSDGTDVLLPYNRLPLKCIHEKGIIVDDNEETKWVSLENNVSALEKHIIQLKIDNSFNGSGNISILNTGYNSYLTRQLFQNDEGKIKEFFSKELGGEIINVRASDYKKVNIPHSIHLKTNLESEIVANNVVIKPLLNLPITENYFTQKERKHLVDFIYKRNQEFESTLEIPSNLSLVELPPNYQFENSLVNINLLYTVKDNIIVTKGSYSFKKTKYQPSEYAQVKRYFDQIIKKFNQPLVFETIEKHQK